MRFHAIPHTVFFHSAGRNTPRISWQVVDVDAGINDRAWPRKVVASCRDEGQARQIADHFNGTNPHASHWQARAQTLVAELARANEQWQGCLDIANKNAAAARAESDRLRNQLFEAREQRDEARDMLKYGVLGAPQPEPDVALRHRIQTVGMLFDDYAQAATAQGSELDALARKYGLHHCPPAVATPVPSVDQVEYRSYEGFRK